MLNPLETEQIFVGTGAILSGHFLLTSGLHSERYLQCAKVLQWPNHAEACAKALAAHFLPQQPEFVISPALGGIIIGHELARALGCRAIFAERENGMLRLRRGFSIKQGEKGVVVEDVITTGGSTAETIKVVQEWGGVVLGACVIVDRSGGKTHFGVPHQSLWNLSIPTYDPEDCPLCRAGSTPIKPGSRTSL
jgi:orotate phosphoribosyltransferase